MLRQQARWRPECGQPRRRRATNPVAVYGAGRRGAASPSLGDWEGGRGAGVVMAGGAGTTGTPTLITRTCLRRTQTPHSPAPRYRSRRHLCRPRVPSAARSGLWRRLRAAVAAVVALTSDLTPAEVTYRLCGSPGVSGLMWQ